MTTGVREGREPRKGGSEGPEKQPLKGPPTWMLKPPRTLAELALGRGGGAVRCGAVQGTLAAARPNAPREGVPSLDRAQANLGLRVEPGSLSPPCPAGAPGSPGSRADRLVIRPSHSSVRELTTPTTAYGVQSLPSSPGSSNLQPGWRTQASEQGGEAAAREGWRDGVLLMVD